MADVRLIDVKKAFGAVEVLKGVDLEIADGEFIVFVGPSGCGKSTLLRTIAGLEEATTGQVWIGDRMVNDLSPSDRGIAMVFQSYALYPHMTAYENMAFGLKLAKTDKAEIDRRVRAAAEALSITDYLDRKPKAMSGGQRQRVAIGRAIVREPEVFLFDEPLSNLDAALRVRMRYEFARLHAELKTTMIYVTHDQVEAMTLADRIVVLNGGRIEQVGAPMALYEHPANLFVAGFIGSPAMNLGQFTVKGDVATVGAAKIQLSKATLDAITPEDGGKVTIGFRPESLDVVSAQDEHSIPVRLSFVEELGSDAYIYGELVGAEESEAKLGSGEDSSQIIVRVPPRTAPEPGETVYVRIRPGQEHIFSASTGKRLPA